VKVSEYLLTPYHPVRELSLMAISWGNEHRRRCS